MCSTDAGNQIKLKAIRKQLIIAADESFDPPLELVALMGFADAFADGDAQGKFRIRAGNCCQKVFRPQVEFTREKAPVFIVPRNKTRHKLRAERLSPFGTTTGQNFTAIVGGHPQTEAMGVLSGTVGRLISTFHCNGILLFLC